MKDQKKKLEQIRKLTQMAEDAALRRVKEAAVARARTLEALARIDSRGLVEPLDIAAHCAQARHAVWQERQRRGLNMRLARETAEWMEQRDAAAKAVGRNRVVARLCLRSKP